LLSGVVCSDHGREAEPAGGDRSREQMFADNDSNSLA